LNRQKQKTKAEVIIESWRLANSEVLSAHELGLIQQAIRSELNSSVGESPASIARVLAEHGVRLKHPDVLDADRRWREAQSHGLFRPEELDFASLVSASDSIRRIDELFQQFASENDPEGQRQVLELVKRVRLELDVIAKSALLSVEEKLIADEARNWLLVWLENPALFEDWFSLRLRSTSFTEKFGPPNEV
jgi:hypothetical protein